MKAEAQRIYAEMEATGQEIQELCYRVKDDRQLYAELEEIVAEIRQGEDARAD